MILEILLAGLIGGAIGESLESQEVKEQHKKELKDKVNAYLDVDKKCSKENNEKIEIVYDVEADIERLKSKYK